MKKEVLLMAIMSVIALAAMADEYIDPQTNVIYTYKPGQPTASVKAGYMEVIEMCGLVEHSGSPGAAGDVEILRNFSVGTEEYVVTSIGESAFRENSNIKSISIPETVTDIKASAFELCDNLATVHLPEGLTQLSQKLFSGCSNLVSVNIPSSVCTICSNAFYNCRSLASLSLPTSLTFVGRDAFYATPWYDALFDEAPDGPFYIGSQLFGYKGDKPMGELVIKEGTTCVGFEALRGCDGLTSISFPKSMAYVDYEAFYGCTGLEAIHITDLAAWCGVEFQPEFQSSSNPLNYAHRLYLNHEEVTDLVIPEEVTFIGDYAFDNCTALTSLTILDGVTTIGTCAFRNCENLTSVTFPPSLVTIGSSAFIWCFNLDAVHISDLTAWCGITLIDNVVNPLKYGAHLYLNGEEVIHLVIPKGVTSINNNVFQNCVHLKSVTIPDGVNSIGENAFSGCSGLVSISLPQSLRRISGGAFERCSNLTSLTIPEGVTSIGLGAFFHCHSLGSITIPASVSSIGESAFFACWPLTSVISQIEEPFEIADDVFELYDEGTYERYFTSATLYVPKGCKERYEATAGWKRFSKIIEDNYRPLVEEGKHWTYDNFMPLRPAKYDHYYFYDLKGDTLIAGQHSLKMYSENYSNDNAIHYEGALYEVDKKVYCFFPEKDKAELIYDFDCAIGDTVHVRAGDLVVKDIQTEDNGGIDIKRYTLCEVNDMSDFSWIEGVGATMDFFHMLPLDGNYNSLNACELNGEKLYEKVEPDLTEEGYHKMGIEGKRWNYVHYHLEDDGWHEEPYSYVVKGDTIIRRTKYKKLYYQDENTERFECLLFETGRTVYKNWDLGNNSYDSPLMTPFFEFGREDFGRVFTWKAELDAGNTNWMVYGVDTIEVNNCQFRRYTCLQKYSEEGETLTTIEYDGEDVWHDIWVEGVGSASNGIEDQNPLAEPPIRRPGEYNAFVSCYEDGVCIFTADDFYIQSDTNPVYDIAYRPFVEEGKVWKVGTISGNPVQVVDYYYFDGDTIVDGKTCKLMMCQRFVSPDFSDEYWTPTPSLSTVGAWYEENQKVYFYDEGKQSMVLKYDFSLGDNETVSLIDDYPPFIIGPRQTGGIEGFKGVYRDVMIDQDTKSTTWLEGVGGIDGPIRNAYPDNLDKMPEFLMSCAVGDEVIYLNDAFEDGATPEGARKGRFDFTHTIKTKPKAPRRSKEEQSIYGEYSDLRLGIHLNPLDDAWLVRIADESGQVVYEKTVNAATVVALSIDISAYAKGRYTVTVENSSETFTGQFEVQAATGICDAARLNNKEKMIDNKLIYNLHGQRISSLRKGLNIVNGQKVFVK